MRVPDRTPLEPGSGREWNAWFMPWAPELFSAPALERILDERRQEGEYQRALAAGDVEAAVAAFEPDGYVREPAPASPSMSATTAASSPAPASTTTPTRRWPERSCLHEHRL